MDSNNEYYNLEADDESSRVDEDVHFRRRRRQRDLDDDDDVVPIHLPPDPHLNPPHHARRRGQPRVVRLQQQVDQLARNFNRMFGQFPARAEECENLSGGNVVDSGSSKTRSREELNEDDLRHSLNQRRSRRRMTRKSLDQGEEIDRGLQERMQRLEQIVREIGPLDDVTA